MDTATEAALSEVNFLGRTGAHLDFYTAPPNVKEEKVKGLSIPDTRSKSQARLTSGLGLISLIYADGEVLQLQSY